MVVWVLVLAFVATDASDARFVLSTSKLPQYNTEKSCNEVGQAMANDLQKKAADRAKVFWYCQGVPYDEIKMALPPPV